MKNNRTKVFLDANVVLAAGKPPGGPELQRVRELAEADIIEILTTDLTITEVKKKHVQNDFEVVKGVAASHFRRVVKEVVGAEIPDVSRSQLRKILNENYTASVGEMFKGLRARELSIDMVPPSTIFAAYAAGEGFFEEGKKDQFPDAFAFECLKSEASPKTPIIIVSQDGDFVKPSKDHPDITLVKSLPELFAALGLVMDKPNLDDFLDTKNEELITAINQELADWSLQGDVEDSEIYETTVTHVEMMRYTAFKPIEEGDPILLVGRVKVTATALYTHPDWDSAMYDSEDKVLIPFEDVSGETEVELEIDVSISLAIDDDGQATQIENLAFRNHNFIYVNLHPYEDYK